MGEAHPMTKAPTEEILDTIPGLVAILTVAVVNHDLVEYCGAAARGFSSGRIRYATRQAPSSSGTASVAAGIAYHSFNHYGQMVVYARILATLNARLLKLEQL